MTRTVRRTRGRALHVGRRGELYVSRGYSVFRSEDWGATWELDARLDTRPWKRWLAATRLGSRLLRHYVAALEVLPDGSRVAVARDGLYVARPGRTSMSRVFTITRGSRPLNVAVDGVGRIFFGEYGRNPARHEIFVYVSDDGGERFHVGYTFRAGEVRHVHNVIHDRFLDRCWVLTGDFGPETGIGLLEKDLSRIEWVARGSQEVRAVGAIVEEHCLLYGTDSELERNRIVRLDKSSGRTVPLASIEGSSLHACSFGPVRVVSTCVEPSEASPGRDSLLYASSDGDSWWPVASYRKDSFSPRFFQFGAIVLPYGHGGLPRGMYSGQALKGLDGLVEVVEFESGLRE